MIMIEMMTEMSDLERKQFTQAVMRLQISIEMEALKTLGQKKPIETKKVVTKIEETKVEVKS